MKEIKFGSIEYFELCSIQDTLKNRYWQRLGLSNYDKLKEEVDSKIEEIHTKHNKERSNYSQI